MILSINLNPQINHWVPLTFTKLAYSCFSYCCSLTLKQIVKNLFDIYIGLRPNTEFLSPTVLGQPYKKDWKSFNKISDWQICL